MEFNFTVEFTFSLNHFLKIFLLKIKLLKEHVAVILIDAKIALCDDKGGVIVDIHQKDGRSALFPCMVTEGLAQRMAADMRFIQCRRGSFFDDAVRLRTAKRLGRIGTF